MKKILTKRSILLALLLIGLVILPFMGLSNYMVRVLVNCLLYSVLALSLNMFSGICGQISLGHIGFFCIGAYTSALMSLRLNAPFGLCFLSAGVLAAVAAILIGIPALKLSGGYLAIITISFSEIIRLVIVNWVSFTRGPMGLPGIPPISLFGWRFSSNIPYYFFMLVFCIIVVILMKHIINSAFGRDLQAIRDDEIAAEARLPAIAVPPARYTQRNRSLSYRPSGCGRRENCPFLFLHSRVLPHTSPDARKSPAADDGSRLPRPAL